jgi:hypothetical protein
MQEACALVCEALAEVAMMGRDTRTEKRKGKCRTTFL